MNKLGVLEDNLKLSAEAIEKYFINGRFEADKMSQIELSRLLNEKSEQVNRALKGGVQPKDYKIRHAAAKVLGI